MWRPNSPQTGIHLITTRWLPQLQVQKWAMRRWLLLHSESQIMGGWGPQRPKPQRHFQQTGTPWGSRTAKTTPGSASLLWECLLTSSRRVPGADTIQRGECVLCYGLRWATGSQMRPALEPGPCSPRKPLSEWLRWVNWRDARCK